LSFTSCAGAQEHNAGVGSGAAISKIAATFLLGEDASGAAAISTKLMYLDACEPRNRTEQIAPTITRRNLGTLENFFLLREALRDSLRKCLDFTDSYKAILIV
jgi:hypothetical protein